MKKDSVQGFVEDQHAVLKVAVRALSHLAQKLLGIST